MVLQTLPHSYQPNQETIAASSRLDRLFRPAHENALPKALEGAIEPSLFFAHSNLEGAFHDRLFAPLALNTSRQAVMSSDLEGLHYCELSVGIDLSIATLHRPDRSRLERLVVQPESGEVFDCEYWAKILYAHCAGIHGVMWTSQDCDPEITVALFPDRLPATALSLVDPPRPILEHDNLQEDVKRYAHRAGIDINLEPPPVRKKTP